MAGIAEAHAHIAAWYLALCGDFWKNKWQQCMHTVNEKAAERSLATLLHANSFICRDERACVLLAKSEFCAESKIRLTLEANAFMGGDESV